MTHTFFTINNVIVLVWGCLRFKLCSPLVPSGGVFRLAVVQPQPSPSLVRYRIYYGTAVPSEGHPYRNQHEESPGGEPSILGNYLSMYMSPDRFF
jgi:hypothetical protein